MIRASLIACVLLSLCGCQSLTSIFARKERADQPNRLVNATDQVTKPKPLSDQDKAQLHLAMGRAAEERDDSESALASYQRAHALGIETTDLLHRMAILHDKRGQSAEAAKLYETVLAQQPNNYEAYCDYGYSLYLSHRWDEAKVRFDQAIGLKPDFNRARNNLAMLLARQGQIDQAMTEFARAGVPQAAAHANLSLAMILDGNASEAHRFMNVAASLDPSPEMQERLASYRRAMKGVEIQLASVQANAVQANAVQANAVNTAAIQHASGQFDSESPRNEGGLAPALYHDAMITE